MVKLIHILIALTVFSFLEAGNLRFRRANWDGNLGQKFANWSNRVKVTVQSSQVDSNLTDFPIYLRLSDLPSGFHTSVKTDGGDIRVAKNDGNSSTDPTELARELVFYDSAADQGEVHTEYIGTLSSTVDSEIYIYYGNAGASDYAEGATYGKHAVWDGGAGYEAVWHLHENAASEAAPEGDDSTSNSWDLTVAGTGDPAQVSGRLGNGWDFEADNDQMSDTATVTHGIGTGNFAMSAWVRPETNYQYMAVGSNGAFVPSFQARLGTDEWGMYWTSDRVSGDGVDLADATWHLAVVSRQGSTIRIYRNGAATATTHTVSTSMADAKHTVGGNTFANNEMDGIIDEYRFLTTFPGADWFDAEYTNQNTPATFYNVGLHEVK